MNAKRKGARSEKKSVDYLEARGYFCTKSAGSLGEWDIIGVGEHGVVLVQVKSNRWPPRTEMERLYAFPSPEGCTKYVHRWDYRKSEPQILNLERRHHDE